jgi:beta-glucosidase
VSLPPGGSAEVGFRLAAADLATWDVTRSRFVVEESEQLVRVGASSADLRLAATLVVHGETVPPRDLSAGVDAADFDDYGAVVLVDADPVRGDAVRATGPGAWVCYRDVDLAAGTELQLSVAHLVAGPVRVLARLDDPLDGEALGAVDVECDGNGYHFVTGSVPVAATGVRDLYVILPAAGVSLRDLRLAGGRPTVDGEARR